MTAEQIVFYLLSTLAVGAGLCVVLPFGRNPLYAALALLSSFLFLAGLMILLSAHLVAVMQVLVYAGAVLVLFVFVVMLLNLRKSDVQAPRITIWKVVGFAAVAVLATKTIVALVAATDGASQANLALEQYEGFGGIRDVGSELMTRYLFPFELVSVLLLVAILGAVVVARRDSPKAGGEGPEGAP